MTEYYRVVRSGRPGVRDIIQVHSALIGEVVEHIGGGLSGAAALLIPEDEVDPLVQVLRDMVALQRLALQPHKLVRAALCPRRQLHIVQVPAVLHPATPLVKAAERLFTPNNQ